MMPSAVEVNGHSRSLTNHSGTDMKFENGHDHRLDSARSDPQTSKAMDPSKAQVFNKQTVDAESKALSREQLAPPLPHITHGFQSLSVIIRRLVQDSYGKLMELVDK